MAPMFLWKLYKLKYNKKLHKITWWQALPSGPFLCWLSPAPISLFPQAQQHQLLPLHSGSACRLPASLSVPSEGYIYIAFPIKKKFLEIYSEENCWRYNSQERPVNKLQPPVLSLLNGNPGSLGSITLDFQFSESVLLYCYSPLYQLYIVQNPVMANRSELT